jgi:hypothetical protein
MNTDILRAEFESQHKGRNLSKHGLRGTYVSAPIAALWNQHLRTASWIIHLASSDQNETLCVANKALLEKYEALKSERIETLNGDIIRYAVITGNAVEGIQLWGPFITHEEAFVWAEAKCDDSLVTIMTGSL